MPFLMTALHAIGIVNVGALLMVYNLLVTTNHYGCLMCGSAANQSSIVGYVAPYNYAFVVLISLIIDWKTMSFNYRIMHTFAKHLLSDVACARVGVWVFYSFMCVSF